MGLTNYGRFAGDFHRLALGIGVMCVFVMTLNRFFWRKLYVLAENNKA